MRIIYAEADNDDQGAISEALPLFDTIMAASVVLFSGVYQNATVIPAAQSDNASASVNIGTGIYFEVINAETVNDQDHPVSLLQLQSGVYFLAIVNNTQSDSDPDSTVSLQSGLYFLVIIAAPGQTEFAPASVGLQGGAYV